MVEREASWTSWLKSKTRSKPTHHLTQSREFLITSNLQSPKNKEHTMKSMELKRLNAIAKSLTEDLKLKMLLVHSKSPTVSWRPQTSYWRRLKPPSVKLKTSWTPFHYTLDSSTTPERKTPNHTTEVPSHSTMPSTPSMTPLIWPPL